MRVTTGRRRFLASLGAAAVSVPFLRVLGASAATEFPRRLIVFMTQNSIGCAGYDGRPDDFWPADASVTGSHVLEPLSAFSDKLLVLRGIDVSSALMGEIPPDHNPDWHNALTGKQAMASGSGWRGSSISVDQLIADRIGEATSQRSLHFGVKSGGHNPLWRAPGESVSSENDPYAAHDRLFSHLALDTAELERVRLEQRSVLDVVREETDATRCRFGREQAEAFDRHLEALRRYELSLETAALGASCAVPDIGARVDPDADASYEVVARAQMDLISMALACDMTRVVTLRLGSGNKLIPAMGSSWEWHRTIHENAAAPELRFEVERNAGRMMAEHFGYLLTQLEAVPEGDGTLLDHSIVLWVTEQGLGCCHRRTDMGYVLGGGGGYFRTGEKRSFYTGERSPQDRPLGVPHNRLLLSLAHAMDVPVDTIGEASLCGGGPLTEIHSG